MATFIDLVYSLTDNTKHGLEQAKENQGNTCDFSQNRKKAGRCFILDNRKQRLF